MQLPKSTCQRLPLEPCCQGAGGAGSAWGWAHINLHSGLGARGTGLLTEAEVAVNWQ